MAHPQAGLPPLLPIAVAGALWALPVLSAGVPDTPVTELDTVVSLVLIGLLRFRRRYPTGLLVATLVMTARHPVLMIRGSGFRSPDPDFASPWVPQATPVIAHNAMLRSGPAGFLVKATPPRDLIGLVRVAADGHTVLSPAATRRLVAAQACGRPPGNGRCGGCGRRPGAGPRC